jgi:hypothetical protein
MMRFDVAASGPAWSEAQPVPYCGTWAYAERIGALLCGDVGHLAVFDVATGQEIGRRFDSQHGGVCGLAVTDDGRRLAEVSSCDGGATIVEWRLDGGDRSVDWWSTLVESDTSDPSASPAMLTRSSPSSSPREIAHRSRT